MELFWVCYLLVPSLMVSFEEVSNKAISQEISIDGLKLRHMNELHLEKENVVSKHEQEKEDFLKAQHKRELKNLQYEQRIVIKQMRIKHNQMYNVLMVVLKPRRGSKSLARKAAVLHRTILRM